MKLLLYSHFFAPSVGGVETIVQSLARGLADLRDAQGDREFEITLVTQTPAANYDDRAFPFRVLRRPGLLQLWRLIRSCDIVHVAGPALAPLLLAQLARKPLVIEHHGYQSTCPNGLLFHHPSKSVCPGHFQVGNYLECMNCNTASGGGLGTFRLLLSTFLRRACSRSATANIAPSRHVAQRNNLPRTTVIFHGVADPLQKTAPNDPRPKLIAGGRSFSSDIKPPSLQGALAPEARNSCIELAWRHSKEESQQIENSSFAYLGRLVVEKGVSVLVEAARLLCHEGRDVQVLLIGDGPERARLETRIAASRLEPCVRITGFLSGEALQRELDGVATIVIPTIMEETAGLAALEQMARGRPVIASAVGGLREIVEGAGLTFPPGDASALADAMRRILDEPGLASSLGALSRQRVLQSFSFTAMIDAHARMYRQELNRHRHNSIGPGAFVW